MMNYAAIPTMYSGVQFRSRLEAKWAVFFDLMRWKWRYEPIDLDGWIPDFVIGNDLETGAYIEVKPVEWYSGRPLDPATARELEHARRMTPLSSRGFLVLGVSPDFDVESAVRLGPVYEPALHRVITGYLYKRNSDGHFDVPIGTGGVNPGLFTGDRYDFPEHSSFDYPSVDLEHAWKRACNVVQYRKPKVLN